MTRLARALVLLLVLSGCSVFAAEEPDPVVSATPVAVPTTATGAPSPTDAEVTEEPEPTPTPTGSATPAPQADEDNPLGLADGEYPDFRQIGQLGAAGTCMYAGEEWCEDTNRNVWPDFVEEAVGRDPTVNECLNADCGGPDLASFDLAQLQENTLFVLDASGSMAGAAGGGQTKMDAARSALIEYVTITPEYADLGLVVYGHRGDNTDAGRPTSCAGIETFAQIGELTFENVESVVAGFQPTGWTPIAAALDAAGPVVQAAAQADAAEGLEGVANRIILISDGLETCDGDPVASAQALLDLGIEVVVDVVGFDIPDSDRAALQQVAEVTGGVYSDAADGAALRDVLGQYDAQRVQVSEALACQVDAIGQTGSCGSELNEAASDHVLELAAEAREEGDDERYTFLIEWDSQARIDALDTRLAIRDDQLVRLEELRDLYREAVERRESFQQGRSDKPIARRIGFDCPFDAHPRMADVVRGPWTRI